MEGFELTFPARAESVSAARRAAAEYGKRLGLTGRPLDELRTVVSEACMNAALHAYDTPGRTFTMALEDVGDEITITVTDRGGGIRPRPVSQTPSGRLGLLLMVALSSRVEISRLAAGGTRVTVGVPLRSQAA
jgi:serine/threonine-protein kinase RsbW